MASVQREAWKSARSMFSKQCKWINSHRSSGKFRNLPPSIVQMNCRFYSQSQMDDLKVDSNDIPDWLPSYDQLPDAPQYLIDFDENDGDKKDDASDMDNIPSDRSAGNHGTELTQSARTSDDITLIENVYDSQLVLDELQNNSILPSPIKMRFTPSHKDVPSEVMVPIENRTALTAEDAANWPVPPWSSPDFVEPQREETQQSLIVQHRVTKYPEMFVHSKEDMMEINVERMVHREKSMELMTHEERTMEENLKDQKLMRQKEVNDYLKKRREPVKVKKLSLVEDDAFRIKVHLIAFVLLTVVYVKYRMAPKWANEYGYQGKDVDRNKRLSKLPIKYRTEGEIRHEQDLGHLMTVNDTLLLQSQLDPKDEQKS